MNNRVHQQFGNYQLLRLIGKGGFAEVYLGEHLQLGSQVAVKILNTQLMTREQEEFLEEAHIVGSLHHPSIIQILDCGIREEDDTPFLVMNYAPNGTLRQRHPKGEVLALPLVASYTKQIASALQYAHNKKLIHRDVKPENMLIGAEQELLLSDFGIALILSSAASQSTKATAGTMAYMAPEQIMGKPRMASDQYALGVVVYEWLCGERPFHGNFSELCAQHLYAPPPSLREKNPAISSTLEKIVFKALAKDPLQRYPTIRDFGEALEHYSLHAEGGEEEDEDTPQAEATHIRGIQISPVEQDEDRNTIEHIDSVFLPAELAYAQDAAPSQQISPQLPENKSKDTRRTRLHLEKRHLITMLMIVLVIGSSLGLTPLIFNMAYKDPGQSAYAQLATTTSHAPTPGTIPTQGKSPTGIPPKQLSPAVSATQPPQLIVTAGNTGPTTIFVPTATPTQIVKSATPTSVPTATPTPTPIITPTPTPTPGVTATPTSTPTPTVTPTPTGIQPTLQATPVNIVNTLSNYCGGSTHGGVGYVDNCSMTLSNTGGSAQVLNWTGSTSGPAYTLSPASGSIAPGQSESVTVTIGLQCPLSFTITFAGQANTVTVPIICTQISVTPDAHSFSSSNCTHGSTGYWSCFITVKAYASNVADTNWSVTTTTPGPTFSPASGTLAAGASEQIFVTIPPSSCPGTNSLNFFVPGSTGDGFDNFLAWSC